MFEALFILTPIAPAQAGGFMVQGSSAALDAVEHELDAGDADLPRSASSAGRTSSGTGSISQIWPMFGIRESIARRSRPMVGHERDHQRRTSRYAWDDDLLAVAGHHHALAGYLSITNNFLPLTKIPEKGITGYIDASDDTQS